MNSDDSLYTSPNRATAGGVIQDVNGKFVSTFAMNLGTCSIMRPELLSIVEGTKLAWEKGIRKLQIQSDLKVAVLMLTSPISANNQHTSLIQEFF
ncbi:Putative ribonuclease H protein At1g65750 [Linum perenne]